MSKDDIFNSFVLTLDIDWAPDCAINMVSDMLIKKSLKATWFVTHDSPAIRRLFEYSELFDFGLHPNFLPGSTQGRDEREIISFLRTILPESKIMRTHALVQSSLLLNMAVDDFGVETDVSLFLPETPNIRPHFIYFGHSQKSLLRIPYFWEDDTEMYNPFKSWDFSSSKYHVEGLKVFDFHPMYIYLNSNSMHQYKELKKLGPIYALDEDAISPFINNDSRGVKNLFDSFTEFIIDKQKDNFTISDISSAWRDKHESRSAG